MSLSSGGRPTVCFATPAIMVYGGKSIVAGAMALLGMRGVTVR